MTRIQRIYADLFGLIRGNPSHLRHPRSINQYTRMKTALVFTGYERLSGLLHLVFIYRARSIARGRRASATRQTYGSIAKARTPARPSARPARRPSPRPLSPGYRAPDRSCPIESERRRWRFAGCNVLWIRGSVARGIRARKRRAPG